MSSYFKPSLTSVKIDAIRVGCQTSWNIFASFVDDPDNSETLRDYMRALFPSIQENWQIYESKREALIKEYINLIEERKNIRTQNFYETICRARAVINKGCKITEESEILSKKIADACELFGTKACKGEVFWMEEFGHFSFGNRPHPEGEEMQKFSEKVVAINYCEIVLLDKIKNATSEIVEGVKNVYKFPKGT